MRGFGSTGKLRKMRRILECGIFRLPLHPNISYNPRVHDFNKFASPTYGGIVQVQTTDRAINSAGYCVVSCPPLFVMFYEFILQIHFRDHCCWRLRRPHGKWDDTNARKNIERNLIGLSTGLRVGDKG